MDLINKELTSSCSLIDFVLDLTLWSCTDNISLLEVSTGGREFVTVCGSKLGSELRTGGSVGGACLLDECGFFMRDHCLRCQL